MISRCRFIEKINGRIVIGKELPLFRQLFSALLPLDAENIH